MTYAPSALVNPSAHSQRGILWAGGVETLDSLLKTRHIYATMSQLMQAGDSWGRWGQLMQAGVGGEGWAAGAGRGRTGRGVGCQPHQMAGEQLPRPRGTMGQRVGPRPARVGLR